MEPRNPATFDPKPADPNGATTAVETASGQPAEMPLPRRFGRLVLLKHLARGGMGEVFLATAGGIEGAERPCVVKIIRREHAADRSFLARFLDEARIQSQLHHRGVAEIQEASTDSTGKPYVVLEYVEGRNLGELRHRATQLGTRIAWPDAAAIGVALTEALAHVHERTDAAGRPLEIAHRDLSPQNVMVGYGGEVKVIDFGTARGENRRCHTVAGVVFAKPGYVAPEVANNTPGGPAADLYAVGVMLWELLAGRRFLTGEASEHLAAVAAGERRPAPLADAVDAPHELDAVIAKLTAHKISARYGSAREAMTDLVALLKRAPSAADGERSVHARIANLARRLYPAEPARTRAEFARLVADARSQRVAPPGITTPTPLDADDDDAALLPGTRYRLVRTLGQGAMGTVYEAEHVDLGRRVALKALSAPASGARERAERFRSEARAVAQLRHDNLVTVFDFGVAADGRPFYVMEYLDGEALDERIAREPRLGWRDVAELGIQACRALEVAHSAGIVHRDIKPGNLFLTRSGTLKLLDFGVAKYAGAAPRADAKAEVVEVFGTPEYMAPEQSLGTADARSDVYALGAVLYELLTGTLPQDRPGGVTRFDAQPRPYPEPVTRRAPRGGIPKMLDQSILKALARNPDHRFRSAAALREALEAALHEPRMARVRRRRWLGSAAAVSLLAVGGLLTYGVVDEQGARAMQSATEPALAWFAAHLPQSVDAPVQSRSVEPTKLAAMEPAALPSATEAAPNEAADEAASATDGSGDADTDEEPGALAAADDDRASEGEALDATAGEEEASAEVEVAAAAAPADDAIATAVAEASELLDSGRELKAHSDLRRLARKYPSDPRVLAALTRAAAATQTWGEAYRTARKWAAAEPGVPARVELARMARAVGKRDEAVTMLKAVLSEQPECAEARELLGRISPTAVVAMK